MNPEDPIAQALDAEYSEGLSDPSRAAAIMKMLPRLLGSEPNIQQYSGLPITGQESLADLGTLAGQGPSGIPGDSQMKANLGQVYANRAQLRQRGDIAEQELIGRRADRTLELLKMMGGAPKPQNVMSLAPGATAFDPNTGRPVYTAPDRPEKPGERWSDPYEMGGAMVQKNLDTGQIRQAVNRPPQVNVTTNIPADEKRSEPFEVTINGKSTMIRQDQRGNNYFAHDGSPVPKDVKITPKIGEVQKKQITGAENTRDALVAYRDILKKWEPEDILFPNKRAVMGTVYNNALLQAKEAYNLGVLNGPDYMILQSLLTDPAGFKGGITSKKALDAQAAKLDKILTKIQAKVSGAPEIPTVGTVENGYRFKGGDPSNQANWERE